MESCAAHDSQRDSIMKLHIASVAIAIVISTAAHSSPQTPAGIASNFFPKAGHYGGIPAPEGPLATILPELKKQARAGDLSAYASVYAGLSRCRALRAYGPEETAIEYCSGVQESDIADAGAWLSTAADKGDERAMYVFSIAGAQELRTSDITARSKSARFDYRSRALTYLTTLAEHCNVDAIDAIYRQKVSGVTFSTRTCRAPTFCNANSSSCIRACSPWMSAQRWRARFRLLKFRGPTRKPASF